MAVTLVCEYLYCHWKGIKNYGFTVQKKGFLLNFEP